MAGTCTVDIEVPDVLRYLTRFGRKEREPQVKVEKERAHEKEERFLRAALTLKSEKNDALQREP